MKKLFLCVSSFCSVAFASGVPAVGLPLAPPAVVSCSATNQCDFDATMYQISNMSSIDVPTQFSLTTARMLPIDDRSGWIIYSYATPDKSAYLSLQVVYPLPKSGVVQDASSNWKGSLVNGYYCRGAPLNPAACSWMLNNNKPEPALPPMPN